MTTKRGTPTRPQTDVERKMAVLAGEDGDEDTHQEPFLYTSQIDAVLTLEADNERKVAMIADLTKNASDNHKFYLMERKLKKTQTELRRAHTAHDSGVTSRIARTTRRQPGIYIPSEEAVNHPMLRTSWIVKVAMIMFAVLQIVEPVFVGTVAVASVRPVDVAVVPVLVNKLCGPCPTCANVCVRSPEDAARSQISVVFFVLTLLMGMFVAYNFVEVREQELRMYIGESESHQPESRQRELDYSIFAFMGVLFVQLIYALYSTSHDVSTWHVALVTLVSLCLEFASFAFLTQFENKYSIA